MDVQTYLSAEGLVLLPALWILGMLLKRTLRMPDWLIPWCLVLVGIIGMTIQTGFGVHAFVQGTIAGAAAVGVHQLYRQTSSKRDEHPPLDDAAPAPKAEEKP
nr:phage holin family protein [bacterium]